ncbi:hypothetical protein BDV95DRAFT_592732 [Massariosphaeria phaeospora]|uniref:Uncharacterized protein n=1 Tax=Massariosphaeria phaeospora TaxID=100035 RepID=A0A7C8I8J4_9PLEO|nr:hypothetical protein BDV95DRAFT_592732 [Massariosphaeria phaeospora]
MELDLEEPEPTVLEYARFHGLCKTYTTEQPSINNIPAPSNNILHTDLRDPPSSSITNPGDKLTKERLAVSKDAALLLHSIHSMQQQSDSGPVATDEHKRILRLKQELPMLRSDDELDLHNFGSPTTPNLTNLNIPFETVDEEKDEGFNWPAKYFAYPEQSEQRAKVEKLAISKDVLLFLQDSVRDSYTLLDLEQVKAENLSYKRNPALRPVTPPLLPLSPPPTPYVPSSPANRLELLSESSNSTLAEAKVLEKQIMQGDALVREGSDGSDPMLLEDLDYEHLTNAVFSESSLPVSKRRAEGLKVEGPLTPPMFSESPLKKLKSVSFPDMLHEYIPDLPSQYENGNDILDNDESIASFYRDVEPFVEEARMKVENEQLSEVDTTMRVEVPHVELSQPISPWNQFGNKLIKKDSGLDTELDAQRKFILHIKRNDLKATPSWHGVAKLERTLEWKLIREQTHVAINEKLHGEDILSSMLAEMAMGDVASSSTEVWKRDGLRILEDAKGSEDELEPAESQELHDMDALIRKRRLELEEEHADTVTQNVQKKNKSAAAFELASRSRTPVHESYHFNRSPAVSGPSPNVRRPNFPAIAPHPEPFSKSQKSRKDAAPKDTDNSLMFGGLFSASTALHRFMEVQGKPVRSSKTANIPSHTMDTPHSPDNNPIIPVELSRVDAEFHAQEATRSMPPPPLPSIPRELPPCTFIISTTLLKQRSLTKEVEKLYPRAEFIDRDFDLPNWATNEADLLLSPSTGLIIATLQQLRQRALPGQPDRSPLRERIGVLQYRYERLVIMISEGLSREMEAHGTGRPLDTRDKETLAHFEKFVSEIEGDVLVEYVRGGEQALARSIVKQMAVYGLPHASQDISSLKFASEETYVSVQKTSISFSLSLPAWEVFLRRAGLNPFAAQVILASMKEPYDLTVTSSSPNSSESSSKSVSVFGLPAFLMMEAEERIDRFQVLLGGSRILKRVSAMMDQEWPSAVHGFTM